MRALLAAVMLAACTDTGASAAKAAPTERLKMGLGSSRQDDEIDVIEDSKRGVTCYIVNGHYSRPNISCVRTP